MIMFYFHKFHVGPVLQHKQRLLEVPSFSNQAYAFKSYAAS